jgi:hypothetical protein
VLIIEIKSFFQEMKKNTIKNQSIFNQKKNQMNNEKGTHKMKNNNKTQ